MGVSLLDGHATRVADCAERGVLGLRSPEAVVNHAVGEFLATLESSKLVTVGTVKALMQAKGVIVSDDVASQVQEDVQRVFDLQAYSLSSRVQE